jgi:hypothetical protein
MFERSWLTYYRDLIQPLISTTDLDLLTSKANLSFYSAA